MSEDVAVDTRKVFVVHGRNMKARDDMFDFLRAIDLRPIEWNDAVSMTGEGSPYIGNILDAAFHEAQAVVALFTPDDIAYLRDEYAGQHDQAEVTPHPQPRPNVLFEAGMAFGTHPTRTILVELGHIHPITDIVGRHVVRMDGSVRRKQELIGRLRTAGCNLNSNGSDWMREGLLVPPEPPGGGLPLGRRLPPSDKEPIALEARYVRSGKNGYLLIANRGAVDLFDISVEFPEGGSYPIAELPVERLPAGRTTRAPMMHSIGSGPNRFDIELVAHTAEGQEIRKREFIDLS